MSRGPVPGAELGVDPQWLVEYDVVVGLAPQALVEVVTDPFDLTGAERLLMFVLLVGDEAGAIAVVQILHRSGDALPQEGVRRPQRGLAPWLPTPGPGFCRPPR